MGAYLDTPIKTKHTLESSNNILKYCASSMQGWRMNMEDSEICDLSLNNGNNQLFGVFDGHGGEEVAKFVKEHFVKELISNKNYQNHQYKQALVETFKKMDDLLFTPAGEQRLAEIKGQGATPGTSQAGCTGNVVLITPYKIYCANAGDSRSVLCESGTAKALSEDHKPENKQELDRIRSAGGEVWEGRVNGNLNLSRAIGDLEYKQDKSIEWNKQLIISEPEVSEHDITKNKPDFIVMGCDGIWEQMSNQQVVTYFQNEMSKKDLRKCVEDFLDQTLAPNVNQMHGLDNMTCILIKFSK